MDSIPLILFLLVFILILFGYPVALTLGGISILAGLFFFDVDFFYLVSLRIYGIMNNFVLLAVPLFVFMGLTLEKSGIAERLLETMAILFGRIKGGLAYSVVIVGGMLAASTGIVGATVVTMGLISLPTMLKRGYDAKLATGVIASSGTLGQIIPPSVVLVLLGSILNISVGNLFISALLPGITLVFLYLVYIGIITYFSPSSAPAMPSEMIKEFKEKTSITNIINAFLLPFIILGGIFGGVVTATEGAGLAVVAALVIGLIYKEFDFKRLYEAATEGAIQTASVMLLVAASVLLGEFLTIEQIPQKVAESIIDFTKNKFAVLLILNVFLLIIGFFLHSVAAIILTVPIVMPLVNAVGIDPVHFGIIVTLNLAIGQQTPPVASVLVTACSVAKADIWDVTRANIMFICVL